MISAPSAIRLIRKVSFKMIGQRRCWKQMVLWKIIPEGCPNFAQWIFGLFLPSPDTSYLEKSDVQTLTIPD